MTIPITDMNDGTENGEIIENKPSIFSMNAYSINDRPVFYGREGEGSVFCLPEKSWVASPSYLDFFDKREIRPSDMGNIVLNGLIDDEDFNSLKGAGLIDPMLQQIHEKMRELISKVEALERNQPVDPTLVKAEESLMDSVDEEGDESDDSSDNNDEEDTSEISEEPNDDENSEINEEDKEAVAHAMSVLQQILDGVRGLDIQEKHLLELLKNNGSGSDESTENDSSFEREAT